MSDAWVSPLSRAVRPPTWFDQHAPQQSTTPSPTLAPRPVEGPTFNAESPPPGVSLGLDVQPLDEAAFQQWYRTRAARLGLDPDPDNPQHFYDYRAAYRAGAEPDATGHWPSEFKREGHPRLVVDGVNTKTGELPGQAPRWLSHLQTLINPEAQTATPAAQAAPGATIAPRPVPQVSAPAVPPLEAPAPEPPPDLPAGAPNPAPDAQLPPPRVTSSSRASSDLLTPADLAEPVFRALSWAADQLTSAAKQVAPLVRAGDPFGSADAPTITLDDTMRALSVPYGLMTGGLEGAKKAWRGEPYPQLGDVLTQAGVKLPTLRVPVPGESPDWFRQGGGREIAVGQAAVNLAGDPLNWLDASVKGSMVLFGMVPAWNFQRLAKAAREAAPLRGGRVITITNDLVKADWGPQFVAAARAAGYDDRVIASTMDTIEGLANTFKAHPDLLPQGAEMSTAPKTYGELLSAWKENGDFRFTVDINQTCARVRKYWETAHAVEQDLGRPLNASELLVLGQEMRRRGEIPGCIFCYVEAARRGRGQAAWEFATRTADELKALRADPAEAKVFEPQWLGRREELRQALDWDLAEYARQVTRDDLRAANRAAGGLRQDAVEHFDKWLMNQKAAQITGHSTYNHEILTLSDAIASDLNARAGIRWFSSTDLDPTQVLEAYKAVADSSVRGMAGHFYTKEPYAVEIFADTGMKMNLSVAVKWDPRLRQYVSDTYNGMPLDVALELRARHQNAGTMLVAQDYDQLLWGLDNPNVDMIIPHHSGNWGAGGVENYGRFGLDDFASSQHEKWVPGYNPGKSVGDVFGEQLYFKHWLTQAKGNPRKAADLYLDFCRKNHIQPKYSYGNYTSHATGGKVPMPDLTAHPNYYKILTDYARTETPQRALDVTKVNTEALTQYLDEFLKRGGWGDLDKADPATVAATKGAIARGEAEQLGPREVALLTEAPSEPRAVNVIPRDLRANPTSAEAARQRALQGQRDLAATQAGRAERQALPTRAPLPMHDNDPMRAKAGEFDITTAQARHRFLYDPATDTFLIGAPGGMRHAEDWARAGGQPGEAFDRQVRGYIFPPSKFSPQGQIEFDRGTPDDGTLRAIEALLKSGATPETTIGGVSEQWQNKARELYDATYGQARETRGWGSEIKYMAPELVEAPTAAPARQGGLFPAPEGEREGLYIAGGSIGRNVPTARFSEPAPTIKANGAREPARVMLDEAIYGVPDRGLARLQTIPDQYPLPRDKSLARTIIGNGVPPKLAEHVIGVMFPAEGRVRGLDLFAGGGITELGLADKVKFVGAVEYDPQIAAWYERAHGRPVTVGDVAKQDYTPYRGKVQYIHASPVCKQFSKANPSKGEIASDVRSAEGVARAIREVQPRYVSIENVADYAQSESWKVIQRELKAQGYQIDARVYEASDYGVPQRRQRFIVRATKNTEIGLPAPARQPQAGWGPAIEKLYLPEDQLGAWQRPRLEKQGVTLADTVKVKPPKGGAKPAGQPTSDDRLTRLARELKPTQYARETGFVLPDGSRRGRFMPVGRYAAWHEGTLGRSGLTLSGVQSLGVVRVSPGHGISVGAPITEAAARTIVDDWLAMGWDTLHVDVARDLNREGGDLVTRAFKMPVTADTLRTYINQALARRAK